MRNPFARCPEGGTARRLHAVIFTEPEPTIAAVRRLRGEGFEIDDVHTPFPVHGLPEAMGLRDTHLPWATLIGAIFGGGLALSFQAWSHVRDWPMNIGGKSELALPALIPVTFELAVLFAAFATVGTLFVRARLRPSALADRQPRPEVSDDRFVVVVRESDASFAPAHFRQVAQAAGCESIVEGWRT